MVLSQLPLYDNSSPIVGNSLNPLFPFASLCFCPLHLPSWSSPLTPVLPHMLSQGFLPQFFLLPLPLVYAWSSLCCGSSCWRCVWKARLPLPRLWASRTFTHMPHSRSLFSFSFATVPKAPGPPHLLSATVTASPAPGCLLQLTLTPARRRHIKQN